MRSSFLPLLALVLGIATAPHVAAAEGGVYESRYVRVEGRVDDVWLKTAGDLGDALFVALEKDLGRAPSKDALPLRLVLHPDRKQFDLATRAFRPRERDTLSEPVGGWTRWHPCESHVWIQADAFDTRRLVLHELVHQFYGRSQVASRRGRGPAWYREGLAEWYGWHRRTKAGVEFGAFDAATRNGRLARVKSRVQAASWRAYLVGRGEVRPSYDDAIALVGALRGTENAVLRSAFRAFESDLLSRGGGLKAFENKFAKHRELLEAEVESWWKAQRPRWIVFGRGWDEASGYLWAEAGPGSLAQSAATPRAWVGFVTTVRLPSGGKVAGGIALHSPGPTVGPADILIRLQRGRLLVTREEGRVRSIMRGKALPPGGVEVHSRVIPEGGEYWLEVHRQAAGLSIEILVRGGERVVLSLSPSELGVKPEALMMQDPYLLAEGGAVRFWKPKISGPSTPPKAPKSGK